MSTSDQNFSVLARFLSCFRDEVSGHAAAPLSAEDRDSLSRLASGEVAQSTERDRLVALLLQSPGALALFAELLKKN